jgi:uncharacterized damage-inducible protein DinB
MHNVRVWHLEKRAPHLARGLAVFQTQERPDKAGLRAAFGASGSAVEAFLAGLVAGEKKVRGSKKGVHTTLAYFVAHESHHRDSILLTLKECGHKLDPADAYAIWDWDRM